MGCFVSMCSRGESVEDQYESLVVDKPAPVQLNPIHVESSDSSGQVLFPEIQESSSDEPVVLPDPKVHDGEISAIQSNPKLD